jgi:superfamily II DNA/RNA helicase
MDFLSLGVRQDLVDALKKQGITEPQPIQERGIPPLLEKRSVYLCAPTGTGKTLAYLLPILQQIDPEAKEAQWVVFAPTHELAVQIQQEALRILQELPNPPRTALLIGGANIKRQIERLKKKPQLIIGSPGRVLELTDQGKLKLKGLQGIVVDEADRILQDRDAGEVLKLRGRAPLQQVFVSATSTAEALSTIRKLNPDLLWIEAASNRVNPDIEHFFFRVEERNKADLLRRLVRAIDPERAIVFVHRNRAAELVRAKMEHYGIPVVDLQGSRNKMERKQAMERFRKGDVQLLLASDRGARGLDIKGVTHIFNYDPPSNPQDYLHRAGRTGRAGEEGFCITLVSEQEVRLIRRYESELNIPFTEAFIREGEIYAIDPDA